MYSILKSLRNRMFLFGLSMGVIFPIFANFFVEWKPGFLPYFVVSAILAGITVGLVNSMMVKKFLVTRIAEISQLSDKLASGNITARLHLQSADQIGEISKHLNNFLATNQSDFATITDLANQLDHNIENLNSIAAQLRTQLSHSSQDSIVHVNSSLQEAIHETVESISSFESILLSQNSSQEQIIALKSMISAITQSLAAIESITLKSNILSVNASVEAARQGERGKGFSVVAREMMELSAETKQIAHEVDALIIDLEKRIELVADSITDTGVTVETSATALQKTVTNLQQQSSLINTITDKFSDSGSRVINSSETLQVIKNKLQKITGKYS